MMMVSVRRKDVDFRMGFAHGHDIMTMVIYRAMKTMPAGQFKARCLRVMDEVNSTREPVLITKKGKPVAKLVPTEQSLDDFLGKLSGVMKIVGDITEPIEDPDAWESAR
jgi:prevent-host-death family protein